MTTDEKKKARIENFYEDLQPVAKEFLRTARIGGLTNMASITVDPRSGYIYAYTHESEISMCRISEDAEFETWDTGQAKKEENDG